VRLNCKQVRKFQQNRSTSATATASLVRSLKSISVHYRHRRDWLSSVRPYEWQDFSTPKVCVQNVHRVLEVERKLQDVDATAWPLYRWPPGGNVSTPRSGATSARRRHESGCGTHAPAASTKSGLRSGLLAGHRAGVMKYGVSWVNRCTVSCALWSGHLSAWLQYVTLYWKLKYFVVNIWILVTRAINNIFLMKFGNSVTDIFVFRNQAHAIWLGCVQIWHFCLTMSRVIVFFVDTM